MLHDVILLLVRGKTRAHWTMLLLSADAAMALTRRAAGRDKEKNV